jgi:hypothetical protein
LPGAAVAAAHARVIGHGTLGKGNVATATGGVEEPKSLSVRVVATPAQAVTVSTYVLCSKTQVPTGNEHEMLTASKSSKFTVRTPLTKALALPVAHPKSWCTVVVYSKLSRPGKETVQILAG